jgi:predicted nucleic acid-binding protein
MIVVSDSGPLAYLVQIGVADGLPTLYQQVYVPPTVMSELCHARSPVAAWANQPPLWLITAKPQAVPEDFSLDDGEREAIALALEIGAKILLMDEKKGRAAAQSRGIAVAGTLAVILDGDSRDVFDGLAALDRLAATNFYASAELLQSVRQLVIAARNKTG